MFTIHCDDYFARHRQCAAIHRGTPSGADGMNSQTKIPKVPRRLRRIKSNEGCYEPLEISIGPYHHGKEHLQHMQELKVSTEREYIEARNSTRDQLWGEVKKVAGDAMKFYEEGATQQMSEEDFTDLMFQDGCFILQFIWEKVKMRPDDYAFVGGELFLLENQLPFMVLKALVGGFSDGQACSNLVSNMRDFIRKNWPTPSTKKESCRSWKEEEPIHLLQLLREYLLLPTEVNATASAPPGISRGQKLRDLYGAWAGKCARALGFRGCTVQADERGCSNDSGDRHNAEEQRVAVNDGEEQMRVGERAREDDNWDTFPSAMELKKVGISCRASGTHSFSDVRFRHTGALLRLRGELELPMMVVEDSTKSILLNLVAYEMCAEKSADVASYVWFLCRLINHPGDVMVLRSEGILQKMLGRDKEVADLFSTMAEGLVPDPKAYESVVKQIDAHCKSRAKMWIMERFYTYFEAPWARISLVAAAIALALGFIQAYFAVRQSHGSQ